MAIYTRTGDKGETSLFSGKRVKKNNIRIETYGTLDELNSLLGVVEAHLPHTPKKKIASVKDSLYSLQETIFFICSYLADLSDALDELQLKDRIIRLEQEIDSMTAQLPVLSNFIFPSGGKAGSFLHQARSVSRRSERQLITLAQHESVAPEVIAYINRLSDYLFTLARYVNHLEKKKEKIWER